MLIENLISSYVEDFIHYFLKLNNLDSFVEVILNFGDLSEYFFDFISYALFFLPVVYLKPLFALIFSIIAFRILIAVLKFILDLLPVW